MSIAGSEHPVELWHPPTTFRDTLADTERVASLLLDQLDGQLLIRAADVQFLARRVHDLARAAHRALPPEVT